MAQQDTEKPEPTPAEKLFLRGNALQRRDQLDDALKVYAEALRLDPEYYHALNNSGVALRRQNKYQAAIACYRRALEIEPKNADCLGNLGNALKDLDRMVEALEAHRAAIALKPDDPGTRYNYGVALRDAGEFKDALAEFDFVCAAKPDDPKPQWDRAIALLSLGRFKEGWQAYESRWGLGELPIRPYDAPRWQGESFAGKTLLLYPEQGFGDTILASRFLPMVKERGGRVILECKPALTRLFTGIAGVDELVVPKEPSTKFDVHFPLMSLPGLFDASLVNLPPPPQLSVPEAAHDAVRPLIEPGGDRFKVGIVWSGSITFKGNAKRSVAAERFLTFAEVPGIQLYSLQKGPREEELGELGADAVIIDIGSKVEDFAETAAAIQQLDLVLMTDSSVAHLAGTLGRPIWNLLGYSPYWLYGRKGKATPWYPSMRMFRQSDPGNWDEVFEKAQRALKKAVKQKASGKWPA